jgi:ubiquinone/menaquinone biosynthesis C-methylase UbiE
MKDWNEKFEFKLNKIKNVFDIEKVLSAPTDVKSIAKYYKINIIPYSIIYRGNDFIHTALSKNNVYDRENDILEQARIVEGYFDKDTKRVLELATGRGANSFYLSEKHPEFEFVGLDLPDGQASFAIKKSKKTKNFRVVEGDFHDLSQFPENHFDIGFIVEALCHSSDKAKVLREVRRVLKPGGRFIIFDAYTKDRKLTETEITIKKLVERGMAVPDFPFISDFKKIINDSGFRIVKEEDLSPMTIPTFKRIEKYANRFFNFRRPIQKAIVKIFPPIFLYNAISGYLLKDSIESELSRYMLFVIEKK